MALKTSVQTKAAALNAQLALFDGGYINVYSGSEPASTATAITDQVLLSTHALSATAFAATATATATANAIASATAAASGEANFYRAYDSDDVCHRQGSAGEAAAEFILNDVDIIEGGTVTISGWTVTQG